MNEQIIEQLLKIKEITEYESLQSAEDCQYACEKVNLIVTEILQNYKNNEK